MILLVDSTNRHEYEELLESMFRLRKRMFIDTLGWSIPHKDGLEIDQFDNENTIYFIATDDGKKCLGTWRAYPTTKPYMVETVFPEFWGEREIIKHENAYEFSRSVVDWEYFGGDVRAARNIHIELYCATIEWCIIHDVFEVVSFTDPRITRRTNYLYGEPTWKGEVMDCGDGGYAQCVIYQPNLQQLTKFRRELKMPTPAIAQYVSGAGELRPEIKIQHAS